MGLRIPRKRGAHGVDGDVGQRHPGQIAAAGDEGRDRVEVLAIGLDGVRRGLAGAAVCEERGEPLRSRTLDATLRWVAAGQRRSRRNRDRDPASRSRHAAPHVRAFKSASWPRSISPTLTASASRARRQASANEFADSIISPAHSNLVLAILKGSLVTTASAPIAP
jgi:hypothetical protein